MGLRRGMKARDPRTGKVVTFQPRGSRRDTRRRFPRLGRGALLVLALAVVAVSMQAYPAIYAESITGRVTHVRDGDTIEVAGRRSD